MKKRKELRKKHRIRKKKLFFENNLIFGLFVFFSLLLSLFYFVFFHPLFQIEKIEFEDNEKTEDTKIENFIREKTSTRIFFLESESIFLAISNQIRLGVLDNFPIIEDVKIEKIFPNKIKITTKEREAFAIWCKMVKRDTCYYINNNGIIFEKVKDPKKNLMYFIKSENFSLGEVAIDKEKLKNIVFINNELLKSDININYFYIESENKIKAYVMGGWFILFSGEKIERQIENFNLMINEIEKQDEKSLKYIDLRFGDRIFYK